MAKVLARASRSRSCGSWEESCRVGRRVAVGQVILWTVACFGLWISAEDSDSGVSPTWLRILTLSFPCVFHTHFTVVLLKVFQITLKSRKLKFFLHTCSRGGNTQSLVFIFSMAKAITMALAVNTDYVDAQFWTFYTQVELYYTDCLKFSFAYCTHTLSCPYIQKCLLLKAVLCSILSTDHDIFDNLLGVILVFPFFSFCY